MSINYHKILKWMNMLLGRSVYHVNQDEGKIYSLEGVEGYYNNLTEKVSRFGEKGDNVPKTVVDTGEEIYFSIAIMQYGLGAYDLYLLHKDVSMIGKVLACADWAVENQQFDGSWKTFSYENPKHPYSSMAQGEGISLLIRAYIITSIEKYKIATTKALSFMLLPLEKGGTTKYEGNDIYFYECTEDPLILNGWIFSIWGIYDYYKFFQDTKAKQIFDATILTLEKKLSDFDIGYWSKYEDGRRICSPFYHKLHIAQLSVMADLTGMDIYQEYAIKWEKYQSILGNRIRSFFIKVYQKIFE